MGVIHRFNKDHDKPGWAGVEPLQYDVGDGVAGTKHVVLGPNDGSAHYAIRYFEVVEGGRSSFDRHAHDHGVILVKGRAKLFLAGEIHELEPGDAVYIPPFEEHQFTNIGEGPLGFLCVSVPPGDRAGVPDPAR